MAAMRTSLQDRARRLTTRHY